MEIISDQKWRNYFRTQFVQKKNWKPTFVCTFNDYITYIDFIAKIRKNDHVLFNCKP